MARKIAMVKKQAALKEDTKDWTIFNTMTRTAQERIAAVTFLINQSLSPGQRMDRSRILKRRIK